jgi:hypothetical protein
MGIMQRTYMTLCEPGRGYRWSNEEERRRMIKDSTLSEPEIRLQRTLRLLGGWQRTVVGNEERSAASGVGAGSTPAWVASRILFSCRRGRGVRLGVEGSGSASEVVLVLGLVLVGDGEVELGIRLGLLLLLLLPDVEHG